MGEYKRLSISITKSGGDVMVSKKTVIEQLKKIDFDYKGWGKGEISELPHIIIPGEEIYECVNGVYEGGFGLLVATDIRVLLVDKKPLNYLNVEDLRFDMISELDYSHRAFGAEISISSGSKNLKFRSYNQARLRKLIGHVQHCMAETKKKQSSHQDTQVSHLEQINRQLQTYLVAQQQYQLQLQQMNSAKESKEQAAADLPEPPKPANDLADYLYAQSLLDQYQQTHDMKLNSNPTAPSFSLDNPKQPAAEPASEPVKIGNMAEIDSKEIYDEGMKEVFGKLSSTESTSSTASAATVQDDGKKAAGHRIFHGDINPLHIAYAKLPMLLKNRRLVSLNRGDQDRQMPGSAAPTTGRI
ncbi:MAG TPA: PH domain-containing protein [Candidatus Saccharimonadales bacterium]|nr:PH domain-containing protein [Candidatus Saccharimonadales bacterium]